MMKQPHTDPACRTVRSLAGRVVILALALPAAAALTARAQLVFEARQDVTRESVRETAPVPAVLVVDGKARNVSLLGRTESGLLVNQRAEGGEQKTIVPLDRVQGVSFVLDMDRFALREAVNYRRWSRAVEILHPALYPTFPYLDLPGNDAVAQTADLGELLMRVAEAARDQAQDEEARAAAKQQFVTAYQVLQLAARVGWFEQAPLAAARSARCLIAIGEPAKARALLAAMPAPMVDEPGYGLFWLLSGQLAYAGGDTNAAMNAAINAVVFESKDIETFPDALILSGRCYAAIGQPYRARDVYYEVASIFPGTRWSAEARQELRQLLDGGRTAVEEQLSIESVFFGAKEDLNEKARRLLEQADNQE